MSPPGRPKGEYRSAQHEGTPVNTPGRPEDESRSVQHEGAPVGGPPPSIASRDEWIAALRWGVATGIQQGTRGLLLVDPDFAGWPLNDAALLQAITAWLRLPQRRLVLLAAHFGEVPTRHPRFVQWRRDWAHAVQAMQAPEELATSLPSALLDDRHVSVHLIDPVHWRGRASINVRDAHLLRERIDAVLQRSELAFPVNTLGL